MQMEEELTSMQRKSVQESCGRSCSFRGRWPTSQASAIDLLTDAGQTNLHLASARSTRLQLIRPDFTASGASE